MRRWVCCTLVLTACATSRGGASHTGAGLLIVPVTLAANTAMRFECVELPREAETTANIALYYGTSNTEPSDTYGQVWNVQDHNRYFQCPPAVVARFEKDGWR